MKKIFLLAIFGLSYFVTSAQDSRGVPTTSTQATDKQATVWDAILNTWKPAAVDSALIPATSLSARDFSLHALDTVVRLTDRTVPLIVIWGESNAGGLAPNASASAYQLLAQDRISIFNNNSRKFEKLQIAVNNNINHVTLPNNTTFGLEIALIDSIHRIGRPVYLVKAGQGGGVLSQWVTTGAYYDSLRTRLSEAVQLLKNKGYNPQIQFWMSFGINDGTLATNPTTWYNGVTDILNELKSEFGICPTIAMKVTRPGGTYTASHIAIDNQLDSLAKYYPLFSVASTSGATMLDDYHWNKSGLQTIGNRMITNLLDSNGIGASYNLSVLRVGLSAAISGDIDSASVKQGGLSILDQSAQVQKILLSRAVLVNDTTNVTWTNVTNATVTGNNISGTTSNSGAVVSGTTLTGASEFLIAAKITGNGGIIGFAENNTNFNYTTAGANLNAIFVNAGIYKIEGTTITLLTPIGSYGYYRIRHKDDRVYYEASMSATELWQTLGTTTVSYAAKPLIYLKTCVPPGLTTYSGRYGVKSDINKEVRSSQELRDTSLAIQRLITFKTFNGQSNANVDLGLGVVPVSRLHLDEGTATANYQKFTAGTTTGQTTTDGFNVGITSTGIAEVRQYENNPLYFYTSNTERMRISATGDIGISVPTTAAARLHVRPSAASTIIAQFDDFSNNGTFRFNEAGHFIIGTSGNPPWLFPFSGTAYSSIAKSGTGLVVFGQAIGSHAFAVSGAAIAPTSGTFGLTMASIVFQPASGNANFSSITSKSTMGLTGTASGISRGLFINDIYTALAAPNYRAIDISAQVDFAGAHGIYQTGVLMKNRLFGATTIGSATTASPFSVIGLSTGAAADSVLTISSDVVRRAKLSDMIGGTPWLTTGNTLTSTASFGSNTNSGFGINFLGNNVIRGGMTAFGAFSFGQQGSPNARLTLATGGPDAAGIMLKTGGASADSVQFTTLNMSPNGVTTAYTGSVALDGLAGKAYVNKSGGGTGTVWAELRNRDIIQLQSVPSQNVVNPGTITTLNDVFWDVPADMVGRTLIGATVGWATNALTAGTADFNVRVHTRSTNTVVGSVDVPDFTASATDLFQESAASSIVLAAGQRIKLSAAGTGATGSFSNPQVQLIIE
jgi:hypothetical protein